jgi:hypothetical protein
MYAKHVLFMVTLASFTLISTVAEADAPACDWASVTFVHPEDEATVEGKPAEIVVKLNVEWGEGLRRVGIDVDGTQAASKAITDGGSYELSIALDPGTHELAAFVEDGCIGTSHPNSISITVKAPSTAEAGDAPNEGHHPPDEARVAKTEEGSQEAVVAKVDEAPQKVDIVKTEAGPPDAGVAKTEDGSKKGCAVGHTPSSTIIGLSAFGLAVLGAWRLRRAGA